MDNPDFSQSSYTLFWFFPLWGALIHTCSLLFINRNCFFNWNYNAEPFLVGVHQCSVVFRGVQWCSLVFRCSVVFTGVRHLVSPSVWKIGQIKLTTAGWKWNWDCGEWTLKRLWGDETRPKSGWKKLKIKILQRRPFL